MKERRKAPSNHDGRVERIVREVHRLCTRVPDLHRLPDIPEWL